MALLDIQNLDVAFRREGDVIKVVDNFSLKIEAGESLCLVGESGCGKSVTALSIGRLIPSPPVSYSRGQIFLENQDVLKATARQLRELRGSVVNYVFQDPSASLNPVYRIGSQILESLRIHRPASATKATVIRLLENVRISAPEIRFNQFPHQLSGGMQQRVMLAMALASHPKLLVADEPTTALDVTVQAEILELLREVKRESGMSLLLITHNLAIVKDIADQVAVMYAGQIVECGPARPVLSRPFHPYTIALLQSVPKLGAKGVRLKAVPGQPPRPGEFPSGCRFHPRCPRARSDCREKPPELVEVEPRRWVRCPYWSEMEKLP